MKFNIEESQILLHLLKHNLSLNLIDTKKEITYQTLLEKLESGDYVKGRLLHFLYTEISDSVINLESTNKNMLETILKKIKFKATPR